MTDVASHNEFHITESSRKMNFTFQQAPSRLYRVFINVETHLKYMRLCPCVSHSVSSRSAGIIPTSLSESDWHISQPFLTLNTQPHDLRQFHQAGGWVSCQECKYPRPHAGSEVSKAELLRASFWGLRPSCHSASQCCELYPELSRSGDSIGFTLTWVVS